MNTGKSGPSKKKKGKSKKAEVLVYAVEAATANFITHGDQIAHETPEIKEEMLRAVAEVKQTGKTLIC